MTDWILILSSMQRVEDQLKDMKHASAESMLECLRHLQSLNEDH